MTTREIMILARSKRMVQNAEENANYTPVVLKWLGLAHRWATRSGSKHYCSKLMHYRDAVLARSTTLTQQ